MILGNEWDAIEADFQQFYNADLRVVMDEWGCRRLWALIKELPPVSAYKRRTEGRPDVVEHLDAWGRTLMEWWSAKAGQKVTLPVRVAPAQESPGTPVAEPKRIATDNPDEIAAVFAEAAGG